MTAIGPAVEGASTGSRRLVLVESADRLVTITPFGREEAAGYFTSDRVWIQKPRGDMVQDENVSVGEVMKGAGLTQGAFSAHFGSKEELQSAAIAYGQKVSLGRVQRTKSNQSKGSYADRYLSRWHRDNPGDGCTMAALGQEVARSTPEVKTALDQGLEEIFSARGGDRKEAIFRAAALLGGMVLARAVQDPQLSDEILESVRQKLG